MAEAPFPPGWHDVVRRHHSETAGYVVAQTGECLEIQSDEQRPPTGRVPGRDFRPLPATALADFDPPASWFLGVLVCPDDDIAAVRDWFLTLAPTDRDRVALFVHPACDAEAMAAVWHDGGASLPRTVELRGTWEHFHHVYGRLHSDRVYLDHETGGPGQA